MRWSTQDPIPKLYAILDGDALRRSGLPLLEAALALRAAGVRLVQYREKQETREVILGRARAIAASFGGSGAVLLLNDYPELVQPAGFDGVHVGQGDMPVAEVRTLLGPSAVIGVSTHTPSEVAKASASAVDYVAIGPVFATSSKADADMPLGLDGVQAARAATKLPLVAIGGIDSRRAKPILEAGADAVAVIGALFGEKDGVQLRARGLMNSLG